jgi:phosphoribosylanthranilate isomerase
VFQIKICGITSRKDAEAAADAGADAIGLNFFASSPRCVSPVKATEIAESVRGRVRIVGVFVNHSIEQIRAAAESVKLDYIQLHGDEPIEMLGELCDLRVIRAFRCKHGGLEPVIDSVSRVENLGFKLSGVLIDAHEPGTYGGTGQTVDWHAVHGAREQLGELPIVLAGGLRADNVAEAISVAGPDAVDTASGVELSPGVKSQELMTSFVAAASAAF